MAIQLPSKVEKSEIPVGRRWDVKALFDIEVERLKKFVEEKADGEMSAPGASFESSSRAGGTITEQIKSVFGYDDGKLSTSLMNEAESGLLERAAPAEAAILVFSMFKWTAGLVEIFIFVWTAVIGLTNFFVVVVGVLLALLGWIAGFGAARLSHYSSRDKQGWVFLAIGSIGTVTLALVRAGGPDGAIAVIVITVTLAVVVAVFTALEAIGKWKLGEALTKMFQCQRHKAAELHSKSCDRGFWVGVYEAELRYLGQLRAKSIRSDETYVKSSFSQTDPDTRE